MEKDEGDDRASVFYFSLVYYIQSRDMWRPVQDMKKKISLFTIAEKKHRVFGKELLKKKKSSEKDWEVFSFRSPKYFFIIRSPNFRISKTIREDARSKPQNFHQDQDGGGGKFRAPAAFSPSSLANHQCTECRS